MRPTIEEVTCPGCGQQVRFKANWLVDVTRDLALSQEPIFCASCGDLEYELHHMAGEIRPRVVITGISRPAIMERPQVGMTVSRWGSLYVFDGRTWCDCAAIPLDWKGVPQGDDWLVIADRWADGGDELKERMARQYGEPNRMSPRFLGKDGRGTEWTTS